MAGQGLAVVAGWLKQTKANALRAVDAHIAALAFEQHGVVSLAQLVAIGLSPSAVRDRVASGRLHHIHRGVYAVGHARLTREGRWMAAVLACGRGSLLSHGSAGKLLGLAPWSTAAIHVTAPGRTGRRHAGIRAHHSTTLRQEDRVFVNGIPCTGWARTIIDIGALGPRRRAEIALDRAETLRVFDLVELNGALAAAGRRAGAGVVRSLLSEYGIGETELEESLEEEFFALLARHGIPRPRTNEWMRIGAEWIRADFWWPEARLIVEVDGYANHGTRRGFRSDRRRDRNVALNSDIAVLRFEHYEVRNRSAQVAAEVTRMLRQRTATTVA